MHTAYRHSESQSGVHPNGVPDWNRIVNSTGYLAVYFPEHPAAWSTGYLFVHRVIAEQKLGRLLLDSEVVHHRNRDKHDNRPENLEVLSNPEHARHHASENPQTLVPLVCANCGKSFYRRKGNDPSAKGYKAAYCTRRCNGLSRRHLSPEVSQ